MTTGDFRGVLRRSMPKLLAIGAAAVFSLATEVAAQTCGNGQFNGFSVGFDAGLARASTDAAFTRPAVTFTTSRDFSASEDVYGSVIGGRVGYHLQCLSWVFGVEADHSAARLRFGQLHYDPFASSFRDNQFTTRGEIDRLTTIRGRIGWTVTPSWLLYGTAGIAYTRVEHGIGWDYKGVGANSSMSAGISDTKSGLVIGGGAEYAIGNWSLRGEALHVDIGESSLGFRVPTVFGTNTTPQTARWDQSLWITRVGLTYRFNP